MHRHLPLTMVDQAILGAFNLGVNLFLLAVASPAGFGKFAFALATILIVTSLQHALVGMPIMVYVPARDGGDRERLLASFWRADLVFRFVACVAALGVFAIVESSPAYLAAATAALLATMWRETARATLFATGGFARCLAMDATAVATTIGVALVAQRFAEPVVAVLGAIAVGSALGAGLVARRPRRGAAGVAAALADYRTYWPEIRWSIVGAGTTELQGRSYVFVLERLRGFDALGHVQAGRVLVGPATLCADAWAAAARPAIARALAGRDLREALATLRDGALIMGVLVVGYAGALWIMWPYAEAFIFRGRYPDIGFLVACWLVYAAVCVANVVVSVFVQAARGFRGLAFTTIGSTVAVLLLLCVLLWPVPAYYAILAVTLAELVALIWTCVLALGIVVRARVGAIHPASAT